MSYKVGTDWQKIIRVGPALVRGSGEGMQGGRVRPLLKMKYDAFPGSVNYFTYQSRNEHLVKCLGKGDWTSHPSVTSKPANQISVLEVGMCRGNIDQLQWHCSLYQGSWSRLFLFKRFWLARSWSERWTEAQSQNSQDCYVAFRILANCFGMRNQWQSADVAAVYTVTCSAGMQTHFDVACLMSLAYLVATPQWPATKAVKVFICQFFHSLKLIKRLGHLFFF